MAYDAARVRGLFPALGEGWVHLDTTAGMQVPENVVSAVSSAFRRTAPGGPYPASRWSLEPEHEARRAVADLVDADPRGGVVGPGPAVLLRRLDDTADVARWTWVARRRGVSVRWAEIDIESCELSAWQFDDLLTGGTRVVPGHRGVGPGRHARRRRRDRRAHRVRARPHRLRPAPPGDRAARGDGNAT